MERKKLNKILSICFVLILAGAALVSGTFAMNAGGFAMTADENVNTSGRNVKVELIQLQRNGNEFEPYNQSKAIVPIVEQEGLNTDDSGYPVNSNFVDRFVTAKNTGNEPVYVRMLVAMPVEFDPQTGEKPINICFGKWGDETAEGYVESVPQLVAQDVMCDKTLSNIYSIECSTAVAPDRQAPGFAMYGLYMHRDVGNDGDYYTFNNQKINYNISRGLEIKIMIQAIQAEGFNSASEAFGASVLLENPWVVGSSELKAGQLENVLTTLPNGTTIRENIKTVIFDRPAAYEELIAGIEPVPVDGADGKALAYHIPNGDGTYTVYILSDCTMNLPADCSDLFKGMTEMTTLDMKNIDTSNVTDMESMFSGCKKLQTVDTSMWDTSNVKKMGNMFRECSALSVLDVSQWDTSNVVNMAQMFHSCRSLTELETVNWDVSKCSAWSYMFFNCEKMTSVDTAGWVTEKTTNMAYMFANCKNLEAIDTTGWDTSNVTSMGEAFYNCGKLKSLDTSGFKTPKLTSLNQTFHGCSSLTTLDLSNFNIDKVTSIYNLFRNCNNLTTVFVSESWDEAHAAELDKTKEVFYGCTKLKGGSGTEFNKENIYSDYARVDGGPDAPGYFTYKEAKDISSSVDIQ